MTKMQTGTADALNSKKKNDNIRLINKPIKTKR